jgi:hypothetical protein
MPRTVVVATFSILVSAAAADAEPFLLSFRAHIGLRCEGNNCSSVTGLSFPVAVTFDEGITFMDEFESEAGFGSEVWFGPPSFSRPDLPFPDIPSDAEQSGRTMLIKTFTVGTDHLAYFPHLEETFVHSATQRQWGVTLNHGVETQEDLPLTADTVRELLFPGVINYLFSDGGVAVTYSGHALLDDGPAPISEPGTILLLSAAGLAGLTRRRRGRLRT